MNPNSPRRLAVTHDQAATSGERQRAAAERADDNARFIATALGLPIIGPEKEAAEIAAAQRIQPSPLGRPASEADVSSGGGTTARRWEQQTPAERAEAAAASFEAIAQHLRRQKGTQS